VKLTSSCLHCMAGYVAWIDIGLVANQRLMPLIVECLTRKSCQQQNSSDDECLSGAASDCLCAILNKGMEVPLKLQLVQAVDNILSESGVFQFEESVRKFCTDFFLEE